MQLPRKELPPQRNARLAGRIAFGRSERPCVVRSVGEGEARLELASVAGVPNSFDLLLPGYRPQHCRVVWRALREIGVTCHDG